MFKYVKNTMGIREKQALEIAIMEEEKLASKIDYIAMMADIDLSEIEPEEDLFYAEQKIYFGKEIL